MRILSIARISGYIFATMLLAVTALAMIPNKFFIVSTRAVVNAPVQMIASPIYGRVETLTLQVGQAVTSGDVMATVANPNQDQTSLNGLRLERLDLTEKVNNAKGTFAERDGRLKQVETQINTVRNGVLSELSAVIGNSQSTVQSYEARLKEQDALLDRQLVMLKRNMVSDISLEPQRQKRNAAQYELDAARGELKRNEIVRSLISDGIYTGGTVASSLMTLEMERTKIASDQAENGIGIRQMSERRDQVEKLIAREEGRLGKAGAAEVVADHAGQVVSVDASFGDFVRQGQPIAKSLDCREAFAAAVYASRDVEDLAIGTPAMVNYRSLGVKKSGQVQKIVRYFNSGAENRYFAKFPEAEGHEVYVLVKVDEDKNDASLASNDKFFGCHVGEEVIISLGESIVSRMSRYASKAVTTLADAGTTLFASAQAFDLQHIATLERNRAH
ncbi:MAG: hypothetical protein PW791_03480 [Neorhizobium sp.]|nr:hypothetical protein [Neorhizobium sp.]